MGGRYWEKLLNSLFVVPLRERFFCSIKSAHEFREYRFFVNISLMAKQLVCKFLVFVKNLLPSDSGCLFVSGDRNSIHPNILHHAQ
jgi:hypothetical protein